MFCVFRDCALTPLSKSKNSQVTKILHKPNNVEYENVALKIVEMLFTPHET